jgi:hypothetical protein
VSELIDDPCDMDVELVGQDTVNSSRPSRDGRDEDHAAWPYDATSLAECPQPISPRWKVVQRPQQQDCVDSLVGQIDSGCVAHGGVHVIEIDRRGGSLFDVERYQVAVVDAVAKSGQPHRVPARSTPDVSNIAGDRCQVATDDLLGPGELERANAGVGPITLRTELVVLVHWPARIRLHAQV